MTMSKQIFFDHSYTKDNGHKFLKKLGKMGFTLFDRMTEHPGKHFCKFIHFPENAWGSYKYLEFVSVGRGGSEVHKPGFSFNYQNNLKMYFNKINQKVQSEFIHKNYSWKENSKDYHPGWNFVSFKNTPIRNIYFWFTEYEPRNTPKKRKKKVSFKHPNSVESIYGFEMTLTNKGKEFLETILQKKLRPKTKLADGTYLFIKIGRANRLDNIVLQCKSLKTANKFIKSREIFSFDGKDAIAIKNPVKKSNLWSLIIVE